VCVQTVQYRVTDLANEFSDHSVPATIIQLFAVLLVFDRSQSVVDAESCGELCCQISAESLIALVAGQSLSFLVRPRVDQVRSRLSSYTHTHTTT